MRNLILVTLVALLFVVGAIGVFGGGGIVADFFDFLSDWLFSGFRLGCLCFCFGGFCFGFSSHCIFYCRICNFLSDNNG